MHSRKKKEAEKGQDKEREGRRQKVGANTQCCEAFHLEEQVKISFMNFSLKRNRSEDERCGT